MSFIKFNPQNVKELIPEVLDGFSYNIKRDFYYLGENEVQTYFPESFIMENVPFGTYEIQVEIKALNDLKKVFLFSSRRKLRGIFSLKKGESKKFTFSDSVSAIVAGKESQRVPMRDLFLTYLTENPEDVDIFIEAKPVKVPRLFLCGDSTVTDQMAPLPYLPAVTYSSWGQSITAFLDENYAVENQAHSGNTTESFVKEGRFSIVEEFLASKDYVFFQFGHNDQKISHLLPQRDYRKNMIAFIQKVKEKNAFPILVTPLARNTWDSEGNYLDLLIDYDKEIKDLGKEFQIPVVNLHDLSMDFWKKLGKHASQSYFPPGDYTHNNEIGSYLVASFVYEELHRILPNEFPKIEITEYSPEDYIWEDYGKHSEEKVEKSGSEKLHAMESQVDQLVSNIQAVKNSQ